MLISPDPEELWLDAHFMNDHKFNTVTVGRKREVVQFQAMHILKAYLKGKKEKLEREMRSQWIIIRND
eukprot:4185283-Ditylum_brightwellii.AAC.1